jgi:DNA-binding response OmpR family regulator
MRILVVEDYEPLRHSLVRGLREDGHAVDEAADGAAGLGFSESSDYDVIILDVMLPRLDGFQFLKRLRDRRSNARVLILTAKNTVDDRVRGLDLGADDYLIKPFAFESSRRVCAHSSAALIGACRRSFASATSRSTPPRARRAWRDRKSISPRASTPFWRSWRCAAAKS